MFKVYPVEGADGYLWSFYQNGVLVWDNLRDEGGLSGIVYSIWSGSEAHQRFIPGETEVWVRASGNGKWTDIFKITIYLEE